MNPKDLLALDRVPMWSLPAIGAVHGAMATGQGIAKDYGAYNWRDKPILLSEYLSAIERHTACIKDGEWYVADDPDGQITHLGCINANTAIILDAQQCGTLIDDRPRPPSGHWNCATVLENYKNVKAAVRSDREGVPETGVQDAFGGGEGGGEGGSLAEGEA